MHVIDSFRTNHGIYDEVKGTAPKNRPVAIAKALFIEPESCSITYDSAFCAPHFSGIVLLAGRATVIALHAKPPSVPSFLSSG